MALHARWSTHAAACLHRVGVRKMLEFAARAVNGLMLMLWGLREQGWQPARIERWLWRPILGARAPDAVWMDMEQPNGRFLHRFGVFFEDTRGGATVIKHASNKMPLVNLDLSRLSKADADGRHSIAWRSAFQSISNMCIPTLFCLTWHETCEPLQMRSSVRAQISPQAC